MNWTEGTLARHSHGRQNNAMNLRQRQHFADVRANILNTPARKHPVTIFFLQPERTSASREHGQSSQGHHDRQPIPQSCLLNRGSPTQVLNGTPASILDQRKRLLEKPDWAGLDLQTPLDISFPGQVYATKRWTRSLNVPTKRHRDYDDACTTRQLKHMKKGRTRIRIGSQDIQPSLATGSQPSIKRQTKGRRRYPPEPPHMLAQEGRHLPQADPERHNDGNTKASLYDAHQILRTSSTDLETPRLTRHSRPVIHEPVPLRKNYIPLLRRSPSPADDLGSMVVEVEKPNLPVPPSQESEQRNWKAWPAETAYSNTGSNSLLSTDIESDISLPPHLQHRLPSLRLSSETNNSPGPPETVVLDTGDRTRHSSSQRKLSNSGRFRMCQKQPDDVSDLNTAWMKFAHDDDLNSEEFDRDALKQAAHQIVKEMRPSVSPESSPSSHVATQGTE
ncbi:hypothetical protein GGS20DRAFT_523785 [Poronia punctata]|nr:hypothetical protein GGS20DRAFT_523785 [Poronia punctata]